MCLDLFSIADWWGVGIAESGVFSAALGDPGSPPRYLCIHVVVFYRFIFAL
jgi:hypothetical protein